MTGQPEALSVCMLGRPESGKTTYLIALWTVVKTAGDGDPLALRGPLPAATAYLDQGAHRFLAGQAVRRTSRDTGEDVTLDLVLDGEPFVLDQLDVAGETVEAALVSRGLPSVLHGRVARVDGVLLFVHPHDVVRAFTIPEANRLVRAAGDEPEERRNEPLVPPTDEEIRAAAPTAVQLVDLLQVASGAARRRLPVAVVVSAWDAAERADPEARPRPWLADAMPMLSQFLANHADDLPHEVFGISAQGGDYSQEGVAEALAQRETAERVKVVGPDGTGNDLAAPLRWLLQSRA